MIEKKQKNIINYGSATVLEENFDFLQIKVSAQSKVLIFRHSKLKYITNPCISFLSFFVSAPGDVEEKPNDESLKDLAESEELLDEPDESAGPARKRKRKNATEKFYRNVEFTEKLLTYQTAVEICQILNAKKYAIIQYGLDKTTSSWYATVKIKEDDEEQKFVSEVEDKKIAKEILSEEILLFLFKKKNEIKINILPNLLLAKYALANLMEKWNM